MEQEINWVRLRFLALFIAIILGVVWGFLWAMFVPTTEAMNEQSLYLEYVKENCIAYCDKTLGETPNKCLIRGRLAASYYGYCGPSY